MSKTFKFKFSYNGKNYKLTANLTDCYEPKNDDIEVDKFGISAGYWSIYFPYIDGSLSFEAVFLASEYQCTHRLSHILAYDTPDSVGRDIHRSEIKLRIF